VRIVLIRRDVKCITYYKEEIEECDKNAENKALQDEVQLL